MLVSSTRTFDGAIFALEKVGKCLFMGGWNKIVDIQVGLVAHSNAFLCSSIIYRFLGTYIGRSKFFFLSLLSGSLSTYS